MAYDWMCEFAKKHGVKLHFDSPLPQGVAAYKYDLPGGGSVVVLDEHMPEERQNFALAHEVAHILLGHSDEVDHNEEVQANILASELLLPKEEFSPVANSSLRELKEIFPYASYEALARRRMQFIPSVLTISDNGTLTRRLTSEGFNAPNRPIQTEKILIQKSLQSKSDLFENEEGLSLQATYVDLNRGVERVLLIVEEA